MKFPCCVDGWETLACAAHSNAMSHHRLTWTPAQRLHHKLDDSNIVNDAFFEGCGVGGACRLCWAACSLSPTVWKHHTVGMESVSRTVALMGA